MATLIEYISAEAMVYTVVAVLLIEAAFLIILWHRSLTGLPPSETLSFLGSGAAFAVALLAILNEGSVIVLGLCLTVAFIFHCWDLWLRWHR